MKESFPIRLEYGDGSHLFVDIAREDEAEKILTFQEEHYYQKSPLRQIIGYDLPPSVESFRQLRVTKITTILNQKYSLTVRDETGRIVAAVINEVEERPEADPTEKETIAVVEALNRDVGIFSLFETNRVMHLWNLAVRLEYVHHGLATKLVQLTVALAADINGVQVVRAESFNQHAYRVLSILGFTTVKSIDYSSCIQVNESCLLSGNRLARLMALRVSS